MSAVSSIVPVYFSSFILLPGLYIVHDIRSLSIIQHTSISFSSSVLLHSRAQRIIIMFCVIMSYNLSTTKTSPFEELLLFFSPSFKSFSPQKQSLKPQTPKSPSLKLCEQGTEQVKEKKLFNAKQERKLIWNAESIEWERNESVDINKAGD